MSIDRERLAKALCKCADDNFDIHFDYGMAPTYAEAILADIAAQAFVIVPREATEEMIEAGFRARDRGMTMAQSANATWSAMIAASEEPMT